MDNERELIDRLCTAAGMIMEDASAVAVDIGQDTNQLRAKLEGLRRSAADVVSLLDAATVAYERQFFMLQDGGQPRYGNAR